MGVDTVIRQQLRPCKTAINRCIMRNKFISKNRDIEMKNAKYTPQVKNFDIWMKNKEDAIFEQRAYLVVRDL